MERLVPIVEICVGERHRKAMGDIGALADSSAEVGLLHPVVITPDNKVDRRQEAT